MVNGGEYLEVNLNNFQFNDNKPIYLQIVELIKRAIALGELSQDDKLPSIREMSSLLAVNPNTMQRAYSELEKLGITYTKRGMGSFISKGNNNSSELKTSMGIDIAKKFLNDMKDIGIEKEEALEIVKNINDY